MSKGLKIESIDVENIDNDQEKQIIITSAAIKDMACEYGYEIATGPGKGDKIPKRKGSALVHEDMQLAFNELSVHLALIDDAFIHLKKAPKSLEEITGNEIVEKFNIIGFRINGSEENEGFILYGEKTVNHGAISLESPKMSKSSGYLFFDELKEGIKNAVFEVEQYMDGKSQPRYEQSELEFGAANAFDKPID
jgi:hypothetical protein